MGVCTFTRTTLLMFEGGKYRCQTQLIQVNGGMPQLHVIHTVASQCEDCFSVAFDRQWEGDMLVLTL